MNVMRPGMQVHAVPDSEKAYDASGRRLPWAFEQSDTDMSRRRDFEEKGPFGRSVRRRGFSRSKTATPARKEDAVRLENMHAEDAIFNSYKAAQPTRDNVASSKQTALGTGPDGNAVVGRTTSAVPEPSEVILYGYGSDQEWAAISFYERVSDGAILEDYERRPPHQRFDLSLALTRSPSQALLSPAAKAKRNRYFGGEHYIKVTFDSQQAADLACHRSPHPINGYLVYAEPFNSTGPPQDAPIPYSNAGAQIVSTAIPRSFSTANLSLTQTSSTTTTTTTPSDPSSRTAPADTPTRDIERLHPGITSGPHSNQGPQRSATIPNFNTLNLFQPRGVAGGVSTSSGLQPSSRAAIDVRQPSLRLPSAKRAVLLPAEQAFLPPKRTYTGWLAFVSFLGALFIANGSSGPGQTDQGHYAPGGQGGQKGQSDQVRKGANEMTAVESTGQIPRREDGSFDWKNATFYWRVLAWLDNLFGTDMCGLGIEE